MAEKSQPSTSASDPDVFALALGKIEQYKILESLYQKACEENRDLEKKLSNLQKNINKDPRGAPSRVRRSFSITEQILDEATIQQLDHPTEFFQVMEKEKNREIEFLRKESEDTQRDLKKVRHEADELRGQIQLLMNAMTEKDGRMKELEQRFQETLSEEEMRSHLERERVLWDLVHKSASSSWVDVNPWKAPLEEPIPGREDSETHGTAGLRRKTDELQRRITELLNHNEKWNELCQELQKELDRVKGQLLEYQKAEGSVKHNLSEDLKFETKRRKDAEAMSLQARRQVEELEAKVVQLEKQLEDKEKQERQMRVVEEELREKASLYEEQIRSYKEDFENEQRDHNITRGQLDSLRNQWMMIYKDVQEKNQRLTTMSQRLELLEHNNEELQKRLEQANRDAQLIRHHQKQQQQYQQQRTEIPSAENYLSWECQRCTYSNNGTTIVCEMCASLRHHAPLVTSSSRGHRSDTTIRPSTVGLGLSGIYDTKSFGTAPGMGELEEDGISCY